jgi:dTDP-4-dehydrorhamnose 3,5-epimerase
MNIIKTPIAGLYVLEPHVIDDNRGYFYESYNEQFMSQHGLQLHFVQENQSLSTKGVLRGMHIQKKFPTGKLIRVVAGRIWDVVVDMRETSNTYRKWYGLELSSENKKQLYIPENFAHGYLTLSKYAVVLFKVTDYYHPGDEIGFKWDDMDLNLHWPITNNIKIILAEKDKHWKGFKDFL